MKIFIPYHTQLGKTVEDNQVVGGLELFIRHIYEQFDDVITLPIAMEDRRQWRECYKKVRNAILKHAPDVVVCNYGTSTFNTMIEKDFDIPVVWIHHTNGGPMSTIQICQRMHKFRGPIFFVSEKQRNTWDKLSRRMHDKPIPCAGLINPSFVPKPRDVCIDKSFDVCTVGRGRNKPDKDPFALHRLLNREYSQLTSLVFSNWIEQDYCNAGQKITDDDRRTTYWDLPHDEVLEWISASSCYFSTWPDETWGITALEALSFGLPVILACRNDEHASENIAADPSHIIKIPYGERKSAELEEAVDRCLEMVYTDHRQIASETYKKHSLEKWKQQIDEALHSHRR